MSNPNSLSIIIIEKNAKLRSLTVKDYKEEELFKKCGFKKDTDFKKQTEWFVKHDGKKYIISLYGKLEGKAGMENQIELPPPLDNKLFFGALALVGQVKDETNKKTLVNLSIPLWDKLYQKLYGGFEDINELSNNDEDENNDIPTKKKSSKKIVIKNDDADADEEDDGEYSDYDSDDDSNNNSDKDDDKNCYNDEPLVIPDISTELCEEEYDYDS